MTIVSSSPAAEQLPPLPAGARRIAVQAARAAGAILRRNLGLVHEVRYKGEIDLVTDTDLEAERAIVDIIRRAYPSHQVLAEEGSVGGQDQTYRWIVDPLDGTTNYTHGFPVFCTTIALEVAGQVVLGVTYDPTRRELFEARRGRGARLNGRPIAVSAAADLRRSLLATGFPYDRALFASTLRQFDLLSRRCLAVRRIGSAAIALCYVAAGRLDAYWERNVKPWDVAAGSLLVAEAGGVVSAQDGGPFDIRAANILAGAPAIHPQVVQALAEASI